MDCVLYDFKNNENIPENTNWLTNDKDILIGGAPESQIEVDKIKKQGINVFINLMEPKEFDKTQGRIKKLCYNYRKYNKKIIYHNYPLINETALLNHQKNVDPEQLLNIAYMICSLLNNNKVFIHCRDGFGRTGLIAGLLLHIRYKLKYKECLKLMNTHLYHRSVKIPKGAMLPQTSQQFQTLFRIMKKRPHDILFYNDSKYEKFYIFSNFYMRKKNDIMFIDDKNREWMSSEAYYQAHKFSSNSLLFDYIRIADTGGKIYCLGRQKLNSPNIGKTFLNKKYKTVKSKYTKKLMDAIRETKHEKKRKDWDNIRDKVMKKALYFKYTQNSDLLNILVNTKGKLYEYSHRDSYWGTFWKQKGKNKLGYLLKQLRHILQNNLKFKDYEKMK